MATRTRPETRVTWEQARAFRLQRMHLAESLGPRSLRKVVGDLGGVQAQVASAGELQCAVRARGMTPGAPERALARSRALVKTWAMRGTLHWIEAGDFPVWAAAFATRDHWRKPVWQRAFKMSEADVEAMVEAVTGALDGKLLTRVELADEVHRLLHNDDVDEHLRSGWGSALKLVALHGLLCFGPDKGRNVTFVRPDQWLPDWREVEKDEAIQEVCRRYLASHGPATREEFARWWGFQPANARKVIESLEGEVVEVDRDGDRAYIVRRDLRSLQAVEEDADVRLLGMFDAYTLAGLPHDQIVPKAKKEAVYRKGAWVSQVVMRGGRVVGVWKHDRKPRGTAVEVDLFDRRAATKKQITQELEALEPYIGDIASVTTR